MKQKLPVWMHISYQKNYTTRSKIYKLVNGIKKVKKKTTVPPTAAQLNHQQKFGLASKAASLFKEIWLLVHQYKSRAAREPYHLFTPIYNHSIVGEYPDLSVDYATVVISKTRVNVVLNLKWQVFDDGSCKLTWLHCDLHEEWYPLKDAQLIVFIVNSTRQQAYVLSDLKNDEATELEFEVPDYIAGDELHCWMLMKWAKEKMFSDSIYAQRIRL